MDDADVDPLHRMFHASSLDGLDDTLFEVAPIVERFGTQELEQREELFDVILQSTKASAMAASRPLRRKFTWMGVLYIRITPPENT